MTEAFLRVLSHSYLEVDKFLVVLPGRDKEHNPSQSLPLTSECRVLEGDTFRMGASFSSRLEPECLRGGTGLMVWVMAREMGRSLSPKLSCTGTDSKVTTGGQRSLFGSEQIRLWLKCINHKPPCVWITLWTSLCMGGLLNRIWRCRSIYMSS